MNFVKNDLPTEIDALEIEIFSDLHLGSKRCDLKMIRERIERVANTPNVYAILLGDVIDNATKTSVGDTYDEALSPMDQIKLACTLFDPIKSKILGAVGGNHEDRTYKTDGIDLLHFMCSQLGIVDKYDSVSNLLFIRFGSANRQYKRRLCYTLYMTHGTGTGGRTIGGKANGLERRGQIVDADIVCTGHTHQAVTFRETSYKVDPQNNSAYLKEQVFVNASSTLDYEKYAEKFGMKPSSKISPLIVLDGHVKQVLVKL